MRIPLVLSVATRLGRRSGMRAAVLTLELWLRGRLGLPARARPLVVDGCALTVWTYIDVLVVREIFLDGEYDDIGRDRVGSILDLGANVGISVRYFRHRFPDAHIVAVEPDPQLLARLRVNAPDATIVEAAVAPESGAATFFATDEGWSSSLTASAEGRPVEVRTMTVADLLATSSRSRFDLVKLDIEGAEWEVLHDVAAATDCIVGELHHWTGRTGAELRDLLPGWSVSIRPAGDVSGFSARRA